MGSLEVLPGFGEMVCVCLYVYKKEREWVYNTGVFRNSSVSASSIFPACLYTIKFGAQEQ